MLRAEWSHLPWQHPAVGLLPRARHAMDAWWAAQLGRANRGGSADCTPEGHICGLVAAAGLLYQLCAQLCLVSNNLPPLLLQSCQLCLGEGGLVKLGVLSEGSHMIYISHIHWA